MGKPNPTPAKKQQSISSFFTPKSTSNEAPRTQLQASQKPPPETNSDGLEDLYDAESDEEIPIRLSLTNGASKRVLAEDTSASNNNAERPAKRAKGDDGEGSAFFSDTTLHKFISTPSATSKTSPRTERFLYASSGQPRRTETIPEEDEGADEATQARKEQLHKKFVKKLGHPDSIAQIKRRKWQTNEETETLGEGEGDGDGEEEEATPPPTKAKKKGAKTGKLTPLEIQILDIKRKHMDTLLIIEVGYKFKFFGEDARTAAKELSIVCIPGKFRYDERKSST